MSSKWARRTGGIKLFRDRGDFFTTRVDLVAARVTFEPHSRWETYGEYRSLKGREVGDENRGLLFGVNRYFGKKKNWKLGIGWNFTKFSDDLTALDFKDEGLFFRMTTAW